MAKIKYFPNSNPGESAKIANLTVISSSYALTATSASYAITASYAMNGGGGGTTTGSFTGSFTGSLNGTASYALTASYLLGSVISASYASTSSYVQNAQSASYVLNAVSASFATSASFAGSASFATSASFAPSTPTFPYTGSALVTGSIGLTGSYSNFPLIITSSTNQTINWLQSNTFDILLTGSMAVTWSNAQNGQTINIVVTQGTAPSGNLATWPTSNTFFPGGLIPTQSATGGKRDIYTFICIGSNIYGNYIQNY